MLFMWETHAIYVGNTWYLCGNGVYIAQEIQDLCKKHKLWDPYTLINKAYTGPGVTQWPLAPLPPYIVACRLTSFWRTVD